MTLVSFAVLLLFFRPYQRRVLALVEWAVGSTRNLAWFMFIILSLPLALMLS